MKKKILTLLLWLGGSVAFAQSINNQSPVINSVDGSNTTAAKVLTLPQCQSTPGTTATPQTSNWFQMNGNGAALVEFSGNTLAGTYSVQVSNNPTPVSTPGTNIYTVVQDTATYGSGGQGAQTKNWSYMIREGWKYIRFLFTPESGNGGTLNIQVRLFGNPLPGDASRSYVSGVPWKATDQLANSVVQSGAGTIYYDYKLPQTAHGLYVYNNDLGVSGASTWVCTLMAKDPTSGQLQAIAVDQTQPLAAGFNTMVVNPGYNSPYPVATPPASTTFVSLPVGQDLVIKNAFTGSGATTFSQNIVPIQ